MKNLKDLNKSEMLVLENGFIIIHRDRIEELVKKPKKIFDDIIKEFDMIVTKKPFQRIVRKHLENDLEKKEQKKLFDM